VCEHKIYQETGFGTAYTDKLGRVRCWGNAEKLGFNNEI